MHNIKVTIAICTWNRSKQLQATLASMVSMLKPENVKWNIVVIDNGSDDDTADVVRLFHPSLPISCVVESRGGLSFARNKAIEVSTSDYLVFTDDDVLVDSKWLLGYCEAFNRWPGAVVFGGPIEPVFEGYPPRWLLKIMKSVGYVFGQQSFGSKFVELDASLVPLGPYGGNMAFSTSVLKQNHFDVMLGTNQGTYNIGEETKLIRSILATGAQGWWTPEARIEHVIPQSAQSMNYVRRWMVGAGRSEEIVDSNEGLEAKGTIALLLIMIYENCAYYATRILLSPEHWIVHVINASKAKGRLLERWRLKTIRGTH